MARDCRVVTRVEPLPLTPSGEPDYSQPLQDIVALLNTLKEMFSAKREQDKEIYPQANVENNYVGSVQTIAANAVTTITWTFLPDYVYYFKKLYVDALANCTYEWTFQSTFDRTGSIVLNGPDHDFGGRHIKGKGRTTLKLAVTNTGAAVSANISIQSWARRL